MRLMGGSCDRRPRSRPGDGLGRRPVRPEPGHPLEGLGPSFGNSKTFSGLRFNFRDSQVKRISGVNVTFWRPKKDNKDASSTVFRSASLPAAAG